jgi:hypothetical protein
MEQQATSLDIPGEGAEFPPVSTQLGAETGGMACVYPPSGRVTDVWCMV